MPSQRPVTRGFGVIFGLCLNKRLSKQSRCRWFETPSHSLWRHCNARTSTILVLEELNLTGLFKCILGCYNKWYPSETHLKLKSREISFTYNLMLSCEIVSIFSTEHDSIIAVFCANFQSDLATERDVLRTNEISRDLNLRWADLVITVTADVPASTAHNRWTHAVIITSLLRQNDVATSFRRNKWRYYYGMCPLGRDGHDYLSS